MGPRRQGLILMFRFLGRGRSRPTAILLAVAWGTLAMMLLLGFGEGLKKQMALGREGLGRDPVILWAGTTTKSWQGLKPGRRVLLTKEDAEAMRREIPEIVDISGEHARWAVAMNWEKRTASGRLTAAMPCFEHVRSHHPRRGGRFLNDRDQSEGRRVVFLGEELAKRIFESEEPVGKTITIQGVPFTVVGVMIEKMQNSMYGGPDANKATIPLSTFEALFGEQPYQNLLYTIRPDAEAKDVEKKVRGLFARRQHFDPEDESALHVWDTIENRKESDAIMSGVQAFLGLVGAMTLLVAGVGLANMLFVMVHRRTREIGMQMAIGARSSVVTWQIVGESLILAAIGGYLGIGLSWLIVEGVQRVPIQGEAMQFLGRPTLSIPLGAMTALCLVGIGCFAGALPARRASRLNPVEALRHE